MCKINVFRQLALSLLDWNKDDLFIFLWQTPWSVTDNEWKEEGVELEVEILGSILRIFVFWRLIYTYMVTRYFSFEK